MKSLKASSIVELVIALSVISICLAVATRVFVQNNKSTIRFRDAKCQSEFQSLVFEALRSDTLPAIETWIDEETQIITLDLDRSTKYRKVFVLKSNDKQLWRQEFGNE